MGALTRVRRSSRFRFFNYSFHGFAGNPFVNAITGDKFVDPYMYPALCVDYCNKKGTSAHQNKTNTKLTIFLGFKLAGLEAGEWSDTSNKIAFSLTIL
jgi:hypothetical protein